MTKMNIKHDIIAQQSRTSVPQTESLSSSSLKNCCSLACVSAAGLCRAFSAGSMTLERRLKKWMFDACR